MSFEGGNLRRESVSIIIAVGAFVGGEDGNLGAVVDGRLEVL